jgi:hypothetical protein
VVDVAPNALLMVKTSLSVSALSQHPGKVV